MIIFLKGLFGFNYYFMRALQWVICIFISQLYLFLLKKLPFQLDLIKFIHWLLFTFENYRLVQSRPSIVNKTHCALLRPFVPNFLSSSLSLMINIYSKNNRDKICMLIKTNFQQNCHIGIIKLWSASSWKIIYWYYITNKICLHRKKNVVTLRECI